MKPVITFEEWCYKNGWDATRYGKSVWRASRVNIPEKTCGYYTKHSLWYASCTDAPAPAPKNDYCGKCGGETFVIQTVEQQLKEMTVEFTALKKKELMWGTATDELEEVTTYLAESEQKLEAMAKECDRWMENDRLSSIRAETAEKHVAELVRLCNRYDKDTNIMSWEAVMNYIRKNGLDK